MRISYSLGSLLTIQQVEHCAQAADYTDPEAIWIPETWGMENFATLGSLAGSTHCKLGSSIINVYSRSPALVAMGAVTVDALSKGRLILGLGASSTAIVEDLHGYAFERPLSRMREYIRIIRTATSGGRIEYDGEFFHLKGFTLLITPTRTKIPIYLAAVRQKMLELAWDEADGVILYLRPPGEMKDMISAMQYRRRIDVACQIITAVSMDSEKALDRVKRTIAFYVSVGTAYREFLAKTGFAAETREIFDEYKRTGKSQARLVPDQMARSLSVFGTPDECRAALNRFTEAGVDLPIVQFNPVGEVESSFKLLLDTFSGRTP